MAVKQILGKVTVTPKGEYSSGETYKRLDIVTSNGQSYIAKVDNTGVDVTNTNTWLQLVEKPEKGIDYFTEEDIAQLVSMVTDDSESEFNEYYNGKVSDFNSNASSKTSEFNRNYDEKVESFNTIFDTSTDNFDGNYETKLSAFNENASTQTSTFNSVVEQATSDFNSNASTLTETFNTNASEKTSAFNINASEKTQEFNDNVDEKTEQITSQLDNYVQFDNYPSNEKAGVVKSHINGFQVSNDGNPNAAILSKEQYDTIENQYFISKGTLENIKDDYVESSTPVKNLNTSLIDITPKNNAEGTDNIFDDGLESPLYALGGDGKSEQVVTSGKQLLPYPYTETSKTINGIIYTVNDDGSVLLNGTSTGDSSFNFYGSTNGQSTDDIPGNYVSGGIPDAHIRVISREASNYHVLADNSVGFTSIDKSTYTKGYVEIKITSGKKFDNVLIKPMLSNEQSIPWEQYSNGIPSPSPDYEQPINSIEGSVEFACSGKNLCDGVNQNYYLNNDGNLCGQNVGDSGLAINVSQYSQLTVSTQSIQERYRVGCVDSLPTGSDFSTIPVFNGVNKDGTNDSITVDTTDYNYLIVNATNLSVIQVEEGSVATEIKPYIEPNQVTFNLEQEKLRSVGDVKDELVVNLETGDYYKIENVGEVVLDGSDDENWVTTDAYEGYYRYICKISNDTYSPTIGIEAMNNYFTQRINQAQGGYEYLYLQGSNVGINTYIQIKNYSDVEQLKQWLSTHNTIVNYILKTPTTKKLGTLSSEDLAKLKTFKGYNNVTVNTNLGLMNIRFTYGLDIKKYVDNKIAEISAQLIKGE